MLYMDDYKQLMADKLKAEIENSIAKVLEGEGSLDSIIDSVAEMVNDIGIKTLQEITSQSTEIIKQAPEKNDFQKEK
jgi:hypothetical protein